MSQSESAGAGTKPMPKAMLTAKTNFNHARLPRLGAVVNLPVSQLFSPKRKFIVTAYPLCDNETGIHTCYLRALDNGQEVRVSGFYCHLIG
ncbi:hypothetical protein [Larkinella punicea]|uniref:Uncharacterized protein n=1 Tax=Larkinella punicea TaxID=2315727 RepID=A0A368JLT9_9BACT|nr:hypothetical protein [Larkinella punicea]RCR68618.1 hypothetical protein DUE52_16035 [Larkinella punicea]